MAIDRDSTFDGNQITDRTIKQLEVDITNTPSDGQILKINMPTGDFTAIDIGNLSDITTMQTNIVLNAFRIAIQGSLTQFNMVDGIVDEYEDESGIDNPNSINEIYDSVNDLYSPSGDSNVKLLLHLDGTDGATVTTDVSDSAHAITFNGTAQLDTAVKKFGTASLLLDGDSDFLSIPDSADWDIFGSTSNYTIDFWVKHTDHAGSEAYVSQMADANNGWRLERTDGTGLRLLVRTGGSGNIINLTTNTDISDTNWHHVALVKLVSEYGIYLDGVQVGYLSDTSTGNYTASLLIGVTTELNSYFDGSMDDIRIIQSNAFSATPVVGLTDTITVPTSAHIVKNNLTLISNSFTAEAQPDNARIVIFEEDVDSVTLNTDLKAFMSRDAGQTFTTDFATDDKLDIISHGFSNDDRIMVTSSSQDLPAGLDSATVYYIINATTNDFELSLTSGGSAIDITDNGTGTHTAKQVNVVTLSNDGEYESGKNILTGSIDISGQSSGTSMEYQLVTANNKDLKIHGCGLSWD